jgi:hypothetical protein
MLRHNIIDASKVAVARNRRGIVEAQRALGDAVKRMRGKREKEKDFWQGVMSLSQSDDEDHANRPQWDILPAWTHDVAIIKADKQMAKDIMVMYAPDEGEKSVSLTQPTTSSSHVRSLLIQRTLHSGFIRKRRSHQTQPTRQTRTSSYSSCAKKDVFV